MLHDSPVSPLRPVVSSVLVVVEAQSVWDWLNIYHYSRGFLWSSTLGEDDCNDMSPCVLLVVNICVGWRVNYFGRIGPDELGHTHTQNVTHREMFFVFFSNIISKLWSWKLILCRNKVHLLINQLKICTFASRLVPVRIWWGKKGFLGIWRCLHGHFLFVCCYKISSHI